MSWKSTAIATLIVGVYGSVHANERYVPPIVPSDLEAPAGTKLVLVGHAIGTQNYICTPAATPTGGDWFFLGPQATVFDDLGRQIATHFLSRNPFQSGALHATWQHSGDTSAVWARKLRGSTDSAYVAPDAVEWLLLEMTGVQAGPFGGEKLSRTTYLQRVNTAGGVKPPATECSAATINSRRLVAYEADYYFYQ